MPECNIQFGEKFDLNRNIIYSIHIHPEILQFQEMQIAHRNCNKHYGSFYEVQDVLFRLRN